MQQVHAILMNQIRERRAYSLKRRQYKVQGRASPWKWNFMASHHTVTRKQILEDIIFYVVQYVHKPICLCGSTEYTD